MGAGRAGRAEPRSRPPATATGPGGRQGSARHTGAEPAQPAEAVRAVTLDSGVSVPSADWVVAENQLPGTLDWVMSATSRIWGYSDRVSAVRGDVVTLFVDPPARAVSRRAVPDGVLRRARRSAGVAVVARWRAGPPNRRPRWRRARTWSSATGSPPSGSGSTPRGRPGAYLFKLTGSDNGMTAGYIPLCVRDDESTAAFAVMHSVTTWQAYNAYGGRSLYVGPGTVRVGETGHRQPLPGGVVRPPLRPAGLGGAGLHRQRVPAHLPGREPRASTSPISPTSTSTRSPAAWAATGVCSAWATTSTGRAPCATAPPRRWRQGVNLAFLGANAVYRHIRLEPSPLGVDRHQVCYKTDLAKEDPLWGTDPAEVTSNWPDGPVPAARAGAGGLAVRRCRRHGRHGRRRRRVVDLLGHGSHRRATPGPRRPG